MQEAASHAYVRRVRLRKEIAITPLEPTSDHEEIRSWARRNNAVPCEVLPHIVDGEPAVLRFLFEEQARARNDVRLISWEDFFVKFDALGLTFVYDEAVPGHNEILQIEEKSAYRPPAYRVTKLEN